MDDYAQFSSDVIDESTLRAPIEIGEQVLTPWDAFMSEPIRVGGNVEISGNTEIGDEDVTMARATGYDAQYEIGGNTEIGWEWEEEEFSPEGSHGITRHEIGGNVEIGAILAVLTKARDNRQPAPPMRAVDVDAPERDDSNEWALTDTFIGAAETAGADQFPLLSQLMQRCGAGIPARIVRVDTQESYDALRAAGSPEMAAFREKFEDLQDKFNAHARDPYAHERLAEELDDLSWLGAKADEALDQKRIEFDLPPGFEGKHDEWIDDDEIWASLKIPHEDGGAWWVTSVEPLKKSIQEASAHAAEAKLPAAAASVVVGAIPEIGCRLGAATAIKEMAAAVPAILKRPEAKGFQPFVIRIEPKQSPALCALALLALECSQGNAQACGEWDKLSATAPAQIKQAMTQAVAVMKRAKKKAK